MRVLVTGGGGLIGRHAVAALVAQGAEVHVVSRQPEALDGLTQGARIHAVDLFDDKSVDALLSSVRPSHLLHLAWDTTHGLFWQSPSNLDWLAASMRLSRAFISAGGRRIVGAGTCAEYDWTDSALQTGDCIEGETSLRPHLLYGVAKKSCFETLQSFAQSVDVEFAWARVFLLYDPQENSKRLVSSLFEAIGAGRRAACTDGVQIRDFMPASEVGRAFAAILTSDVLGAVNIGSGAPQSIAAMAMSIGRLLGRPELVGLGDLPSRSDDPPRLVPDDRRLFEEVGFRPFITQARALEAYAESVSNAVK
jgi:nucleoside-diphosphate-sugar epimerase